MLFVERKVEGGLMANDVEVEEAEKYFGGAKRQNLDLSFLDGYGYQIYDCRETPKGTTVGTYFILMHAEQSWQCGMM
jgi:hypothetical protein